MATPPVEVELDGTPDVIIGDATALELNASSCAETRGVVRAKCLGPLVQRVGSNGLSEIPLCGEGLHSGLNVAGTKSGKVAADSAFRRFVSRFDDRWAHVVAAVNGHLAAVRSEHHGAVVRCFGHHSDGPESLLPFVVETCQQLDDGSSVDARRCDGLGRRVESRKPRPVFPDELSQPPVTSDRAGTRVLYRDPPRPDRLEVAGSALFERVQVLRHRVSPTCNLGISTRELRGSDEVREPGHRWLQAGDELGHDLCCWLRLPGERNALSGPQ